MARTTVPSFVRDPNQAAELAALLRDMSSNLDLELAGNREDLTRRERTREEQAIARYRQWADELDPPVAEPEQRPTHIRPARELPTAASDA